MNQLNIILFILFCSFLQIGCSTRNNQQDSMMVLPDLIPYRKGDLWGYSDRNKSIKIEPKFSAVMFFDSFGFAIVYDDIEGQVKCGLIDVRGNIIVPITYNVESFSYSVLNYDGQDSVKYGVFRAFRSREKLIVVTPNKNYNSVHQNQKYFVRSSTNGKQEIVNRNGNPILHEPFEYQNHFSSNQNQVEYIIARLPDTKKLVILDSDGKLYNSMDFDKISPLDSNLFVGVNLSADNGIRSSGIYNLKGEPIIEGSYEIGSSKEGDFVSVDDTYFSIKNRKFIGERLSNVRRHYEFYDGIIKVPFKVPFGKKDKVKYKLIYSSSLAELIPGVFDEVEINLFNNHVICKDGFTFKCSNIQGNRVVQFVEVDTVVSIDSDRLLIKMESGVGIWSFSKSKYIIQPKYQSVNVSLPSMYILGHNGKYIMSNINGHIDSNLTFDNFHFKLPEVDFLPNYFIGVGVNSIPLMIVKKSIYTGEQNKNSIMLNVKESNDNNNLVFSLRTKENNALIKFIEETGILVAKRKDSIYIYPIDLNQRLVVANECEGFFRIGKNLFYTETNIKTKQSYPYKSI